MGLGFFPVRFFERFLLDFFLGEDFRAGLPAEDGPGCAEPGPGEGAAPGAQQPLHAEPGQRLAAEAAAAGAPGARQAPPGVAPLRGDGGQMGMGLMSSRCK